MKIFFLCLITTVCTSAWASGGGGGGGHGLGGLPPATTPFVTRAVCLDVNGQPIPKTQGLKHEKKCRVTDNQKIDKLNNE